MGGKDRVKNRSVLQFGLVTLKWGMVDLKSGFSLLNHKALGIMVTPINHESKTFLHVYQFPWVKLKAYIILLLFFVLKEEEKKES